MEIPPKERREIDIIEEKIFELIKIAEKNTIPTEVILIGVANSIYERASSDETIYQKEIIDETFEVINSFLNWENYKRRKNREK